MGFRPTLQKTMITKADIAREFAVTPTTSGRWVDNEGCPTDSIEHVVDWLASLGRTKYVQRRAATKARRDRGESPDEDSLTVEAMLERVRIAEFETYEEVTTATPGPSKAGALKAYREAVQVRITMEQKIVDLLQQTGQMIQPQEARDLMTAALGPVAKKIDSLDDDLAEQVNPADPELARGILAAWKEELKALVRAALEGGSA